MRSLVFALFAAMIGGSALATTSDPMQSTFGNTVVVVKLGAKESYFYFHPDHGFAGRIPALNYLYRGTWNVDANNRLCSWYEIAVPDRTNPECFTFTSHSVGDSWTNPEGETISIVQGTQ